MPLHRSSDLQPPVVSFVLTRHNPGFHQLPMCKALGIKCAHWSHHDVSKSKKHLRPWLYMAVPYSLAFDGCWIMLWHAGAIGLHPAVSRKTSGVAMATNWSQSDAEALVTLVTLVQPFHPFILLHCLFFSDFWGFWYLLILTWSCLVSCVLAPSLEGDSEIRFGQLSRLVAQTWGTVRGTPEKNSDSLILSQ